MATLKLQRWPDEKPQRTATLDRATVDEEARTVELSFSSEEPVERFFGLEILDHSRSAVNLDRLNDGGAVLVNHNPDDHVGVVESARIDSDRKGRAVVRFGKGERASEIFQDIVDGIRRLVSVGYRIDKFEETKGKKGEPSVFRALRWTPFEISTVPIPADATVGVGRSQEKEEMADEDKKPDAKEVVREREVVREAPQVDVKQVQERARKDEQNRIRQIMALGDEHDCRELAREYVDSGKEFPAFQTAVLGLIGKRNADKMAEAEPEKLDGWADRDMTSPQRPELGLTDKETQRFSLLRAMNALANPHDQAAQRAAAFEHEVSVEGAKVSGKDTIRGMYIPPDVLTRVLTAGTATDGAELVADNLLAGSFIDVLRNLMVVRQAGARILDGLVGNVDIPRKTSASATAWISAEDGDAAVSDPQFDQVALRPKDLAAYTEVSRRLLMQSTPAIEGIVRDDLFQAQAIGLDLAALYGSGTSGEPTGVVNTSNINDVIFAAAAPTYPETVQMVRETMTDNALMGSLAYIIDPAGWEDAMITEKATNTGQFIMSTDGRINGYPVFTTNQVTAEDWFFGNWSDLLIGLWGGIELNVDPYTHSLKGKVRFVTFQTADVAVRHAVSFCTGNDAT